MIHGAVHKARPEVAAVIHAHTRAGMAVAATKCGILPLNQTALIRGGRQQRHHGTAFGRAHSNTSGPAHRG
jgi:ribulose-5-phosphate 4-epimerase/fuculose-1-phosphate aldolase